MSKPPHTIDLPQLDELFDDSFERDARRVLQLATTLEGRTQRQPAAPPAAEHSIHGETGSQPPSTPWHQADVSGAVGMLCLVAGLVAVAFAATLFVFGVMERQFVSLQTYIWPVGVAGQLLLVIAVALRRGAREPLHAIPHSLNGTGDHALNGVGNRETRLRLDAGHGVPRPAARRQRKGEHLQQL